MKTAIKDFEKFNVVNNANRKCCNSVKNRTIAKHEFRYEHDKITNSQKREIDRLNKLCFENGLEPITAFKKDFMSRNYAKACIRAKGRELINLGIDIKDYSRISCAECKDFNCKLGSTGICKRTKRTVKSHYRCRLYNEDEKNAK